MNHLYHLSALLFLALLLSCKNAEKLYNQGRYDEAVMLATKKLSKKPGDASLIEIVRNAYRFAVEDHEARINTLSYSTSDLRWEKIYSEYGSLQRLYDAIRRSPSVYDIVQPADYSAPLATYKEEAGNARYERGLDLMEQGDKTGYRKAYDEFQKALSLKPGDIAIRQKMEEAYQNAVTNVIVYPIARSGFQQGSYFHDFNDFNYEMMRYLNNDNNSRFLAYYNSNEAGSRNLRPDFSVDMRFNDMNIGRYRDERQTREVSKQIVGRERVITKDSVVKEYITVKAKITTTTRRLQAYGLLQAVVRDINDRYTWSDTYRGDYNWQYIFATYTGDERALSEEDKKLVQIQEQWPPQQEEIVRLILNEIRNKAECGISDFFKRYN
ncbi:MAG TPA: hypothetical protein PKC69_02775 [Chitinophagaceae bacterium]|nr:hypothetical protein [Chitinophagaceae bacterium]